jgi:hypothetical protein
MQLAEMEDDGTVAGQRIHVSKVSGRIVRLKPGACLVVGAAFRPSAPSKVALFCSASNPRVGSMLQSGACGQGRAAVVQQFENLGQHAQRALGSLVWHQPVNPAVNSDVELPDISVGKQGDEANSAFSSRPDLSDTLMLPYC